MDIFSVDFTYNELVFIRQSLEVVSISGKDAKFLATLQVKLENELAEIGKMLKQEELKKHQQLQDLQAQELEKQTLKKKS